MAEQEVIKHTKKVMKTVSDKEGGWKHKLKEILLEVLIIVFAVSLSISFHNWSEKRHDRHEEHAFLEGLRTDLTNDIREMQSDSTTYQRLLRGTVYFTKVAYGEPLNKDSLDEYNFMFFNTTYFSPNISRFEGLRASGKLSIIENKELLDNILDLYQENIPLINMLNNWFNTYKMDEVAPLLDRQLKLGKDGTDEGNWQELLQTHELQNVLRRALNTDEIVTAYGSGIKTARIILAKIDEELN
jgi:hypothetical protein